MRYSRSLFCSVMFLFTFALASGIPAFAQDSPNVAMGMNPQATYHGGDFDFVDMATGRLHLHIPLVIDHSQRGQLNFTYSVNFDSTGEWTEDYTHRFVHPPKYGLSSPVLVTEGDYAGFLAQDHYRDPTTTQTYYYTLYEGGRGIGSAHTMGTTNGGSLQSIDGSGFRTSSFSLTNRKGLQFSNLIEDTNGNELTNLPANIDTLGRTWGGVREEEAM